MKKYLQRILSCALLCALLATAMPTTASAASSTGFVDVPATCWAADAIQRATELGFFKGETPARFGIGREMTRAAFALVLCRFFGWEMLQPETGSFSDNQNTKAWYYSAVETAYANGAVTNQTGLFRPLDAITREEIASMLIRALGYGTIAGLAQDLSMPFTDVRTNAGYIAMAYELGIVNGTTKTTFSPDKTATREQAAVMLMRLYDRYNAASPDLLGIASSAEDLADLSHFSTVAVAAKKLIYAGEIRLVDTLQEETVSAIRSAAQDAGSSQLLYVTGTATALKGTAAGTASVLATAVEAEGYDGLFLDLSKLGGAQKKDLTALAQALREALGDRSLYLMAEAPVWSGKAYTGYDYAALTQAADHLVLRIAPYSKDTNGFPTSPSEPLEEVYYALAELNSQVDTQKLSLLLTTTGSAWQGSRQLDALSAAEILEMKNASGTSDYYSSRYASAYLIAPTSSSSRVVWYLNEEAAAQHAQLAAFFGVGQLCLSDLSSVADYDGYSLLKGLL